LASTPLEPFQKNTNTLTLCPSSPVLFRAAALVSHLFRACVTFSHSSLGVNSSLQQPNTKKGDVPTKKTRRPGHRWCSGGGGAGVRSSRRSRVRIQKSKSQINPYFFCFWFTRVVCLSMDSNLFQSKGRVVFCTRRLYFL